MNLNLKDKVIIVTGGAKGIGEGIVNVLAQEGAIPVIIGRNEADNKKTLDEIGGKGFQVLAELSKPSECKEAIEKVMKQFSRINVLVNNAGDVKLVDAEKVPVVVFCKLAILIYSC
jgi:NAD(P)-dependent dehydrogenase (short-subunit alcohol dehydrogenase family)